MPNYAVIINVPVHDIHDTCVIIRVTAENATQAQDLAVRQHFGKPVPCTCSVVELLEWEEDAQ